MDSREEAPNSTNDWEKLWDIFHQVREMNAAERANFLNNLETVDPHLRNEVEDLLAVETNDGHRFEDIVNDELILLEEKGAFPGSEIRADTVLSGRFRILRELGRGGMGTVYEAFDEELGSEVALKTMQSEFISDPAARERFYREINLARKVTHPNACRIFDLFQHEDLLFLTMELLPGETLQQKLKRENRLDIESSTEIVLQILEALSEMHRMGIVHRDLKTSNIILVPNNNGGFRAVVTDFGLAIGVTGSESFELTQTGQVFGTPQYMAPEQLKKEQITPATDVYAVGLVLYEMITGELPLKGESPLTIAAKRISEDVPSPKLLVPMLDRKWERIILGCLERNPKHRIQSASDLMDMINGKSFVAWMPIISARHRSRIIFFLFILLAGFLALFYLSQTRKTSLPIGTDVISKRIWTGATGIPGGAISTDGKVLIDIDWAKGNVIAINLRTKKKRLLTKSNVWFHPYDFIEHPVVTLLSPDSKTVGYSIGSKSGSGSELRSVNISGSSVSTMFRSENWITPLDWSSDGHHIAAHLLQKDGSAIIGLISTKNGTFRKLKNVDSTDIRKISFSPDSRYIAYDFMQDNNSANHDLFLISLENESEIRIVAHPANDYLLGWSPDGTRILFASDRSATNDAWSLRIVDGKPQGTPELIRKDIGQIFPLKITNEGSIFYAHMMSAVDVYMAALGGASQPYRITQGDVGFSSSPAFSRDGNFLVFQSLSEPLSSRWTAAHEPLFIKIVSLKSGDVRQVSPDIQSAGGRTRWSGDGQSVFLRGNGPDGPGLYSVDINLGKSSKIVGDLSTNWVRQYHVSPDGKSVFYLMNKDGSIVEKEIASGKENIICDDAADFDLSFDGRWLAVMSTDIYKGFSSLRIIPAEGGLKNPIYKLSMPDWISSVAWMPDGESLIFSQGRRDLIDAPHRLWKISRHGGRAEDLGISSEYVSDLRVHPDGSRIAISTVTDSSEVWVMENFLDTIR